jgi:hypothetical protein
MQKLIPFETALGRFYGRDCVYLDYLTFEGGTSTMVLEGSVNGNLCTLKRSEEFVDYKLQFIGVLALKMEELDSCNWQYESCFDEVKDSEWVRTLGGKVEPHHRHFQLWTYDDVFQIVCHSFEFELQNA